MKNSISTCLGEWGAGSGDTEVDKNQRITT